MSLHFVKPYHKHLIKTSFLLSFLLWGMIPGSIHTVCAETAETDQQLSQTDSHTVAIDPGHQGPNVDMSALEPLGPGSTEMKAKASHGYPGGFHRAWRIPAESGRFPEAGTGAYRPRLHRCAYQKR